MSNSQSVLQPDDPHLEMAKDLKNQGLSNIKIRKELNLIGLEEEYISAIIREINPTYKSTPLVSDRIEGNSQKKSGWKSAWSIIVVVLIILRILMRLARD